MMKFGGGIACDQPKDLVTVKLRYQRISLHQQFVLVDTEWFY